jgi:hypothetical protein
LDAAVVSQAVGRFRRPDGRGPADVLGGAAERAGVTATIDLQREYEVRAVQVNYADHESGLFGPGPNVYTQFRLHVSSDGRQWEVVADLSAEKRDRPNAYVELARPVRARYVRYEHLHVGAKHLAISDIRIFGKGGGRAPRAPRGLTARRDNDPRNVFLEWQRVAGAVGYNILWGIAPDKLYQTYQVWADAGESLEIRALNSGQGYWFAIEAFDENGVSPVTKAIPVP